MKKNTSRVDRAVAFAEQQARFKPIEDDYLLRGKLLLRTRAGKKLDSPAHCQRCGREEKHVWLFSHTSLGPATLCTRCKNTAINDSFGGADAMSLRVNHAHHKR